jgi:hypothetical protein
VGVVRFFERLFIFCFKVVNVMAQSKYDTHVKDKLILVEGWARDGLTEEQIARNLGISYSTFKDYKNKHSALLTALKKGKEVVDYEVENALYKAAVNGNVTAMIFWLKNRKPHGWKDRKEAQEIELQAKELELKAKKFDLEKQKLDQGIKEDLAININIIGDDNAN